MRFTGHHEFSGTAEINNGLVYNASILNKLNIPLHKPLTGAEFGDLFSESNSVKYTNNEGDINLLLDLNNDDIIKALLLTEMLFDDFYNYGSEFNVSNSFHDTILFDTGNDLIQASINIERPMTVYTDGTNNVNTIRIDMASNENALQLFNKMNVFIASNLPISTTFINSTDSTGVTHIVLYDSVFVDSTTVTANVTIGMSALFSELVGMNMVKLETFDFVDDIVGENLVKLPPHEHTLENLKDLIEKTNVPNGYIKLTDNNLRLDFGDLKIWLEKGRISNTIFEIDWLTQLRNETIFKLNRSSSTLTENVDYSTRIVQLADSTIEEYDATTVELLFVDNLELTTKTGWVLSNNATVNVNDMTSWEDSYLVEIIEFDYSDLFIGEDASLVGDIIKTTYQLVPKTDIDTIPIYDINYSTSKITALSGYYEIILVQPNINTIPSITVNFNNVCRDIEDNIILSKPKSFLNINSNTTLNVGTRSKLHIEMLDGTTSDLSVDIYIFSIIDGRFNLLSTVSDDATIMIDSGLYKFIPSTETYNYNIHYYEG